MRIMRLALVAVALLAAPILFAQGRANAELMPAPLTWNGFWQAELSRGFIDAEVTEEGVAELGLREGGLQFALDAWEREPLASDALFIAAIDLRARGESAGLAELLDLSGRLDKRNRLLATLQLEQAVQSGEYERGFAILDRIALAHPSIAPEMTSTVKQILRQDGSVPLLLDVLQREPAWVGSFWNGVPPQPEALRRMYELRLLTDIGTSSETDAILVRGLVDAGYHADALEFWRTTVSDAPQPLAFRQDTSFPPISWQLVSTGQRAMSSRGEGQFEIYAQQYSDGEVARQLLSLPAGRYTLSADISPVSAADAIEARLFCASEDGNAAAPQTLSETAAWNVTSDCSAHWLVLNANAFERRSDIRATISAISFTPAGEGQAP